MSRRVDKAVDGFCHLLRLIEIIEVAGIRDPLDLNIGALRSNIGKYRFWLGRVAVGLELKHWEGEVVLTDFTDGSIQVPVLLQKVSREPHHLHPGGRIRTPDNPDPAG